jgi:microcystin-dependent protein
VFYDGTALYTDQGGGGLTDFPIGGVVMVPGINPPGGFLRLNGGTVSRVTYAGLWGFAQVSGNIAAAGGWTEGKFGPGDGSTTFQLPDLRGNFLRAWDNARTLDNGRLIGSSQADGIETHSHAVDVALGGSHSHTFSDTSSSAGSHSHTLAGRLPLASNVPAGSFGFGAASGGGAYDDTPTISAGGAHTHAIGGTTSVIGTHDHAVTVGANPGATNETRPMNIALLACIKY